MRIRWKRRRRITGGRGSEKEKNKVHDEEHKAEEKEENKLEEEEGGNKVKEEEEENKMEEEDEENKGKRRSRMRWTKDEENKEKESDGLLRLSLFLRSQVRPQHLLLGSPTPLSEIRFKATFGEGSPLPERKRKWKPDLEMEANEAMLCFL